MTLLEVKNDIVQIVIENESFCILDSEGIQVEKDFEDRKNDVIFAALRELENEGVLSKITGESGDVWILSEPLGLQGQDVHLSREMCEQIAAIINAYLDAKQNEGGRCNPLEIDERDIAILVGILVENLHGGAMESGVN